MALHVDEDICDLAAFVDLYYFLRIYNKIFNPHSFFSHFSDFLSVALLVSS